MSKIERTIEVKAPVKTVYNQWTQFEDFPQLMEGVEKVWQLDDKRIRWKAVIGGTVKEWDAEITEQVPDHRIAWKSVSGAPNSGAIGFQPVDEGLTRVHIELEYQPQDLVEIIGDKLGVVEKYVDDSLERFKKYIESHGKPTGAWRGEIHGDAVTQPRGEKGP